MSVPPIPTSSPYDSITQEEQYAKMRREKEPEWVPECDTILCDKLPNETTWSNPEREHMMRYHQYGR
jgi:hypothetical protein